MVSPRKTVSVVMTVKNDCAGCRVTLESLAGQTRKPDEVIVVDGGSTDGTLDVIRQHMANDPPVRLIVAPEVNIARGRNIGVEAAAGEIIATTDAGCRAEAEWLQRLVLPFEEVRPVREASRSVENPGRTIAATPPQCVAGVYRIDPHSLLEEVVGLATMRGQLDPIDEKTFNPSARSFACTKSLWARAGGWPEWLGYSEDTLFDHKIRKMGVGWRVAGDAIVHWRPRRSLRSVAKQFYRYGTGRGHTQIGAPDFRYNLRNVLIVSAAAGLCFVTPWAMAALMGLLGYFYVWTFHHKALRIARRTRRWHAYPLCLLVMWVVLCSNLAGYGVGSWQRWRDRVGYQAKMAAYLACT